jgi:phosphopantetheinyl transferase
VTFVAAPLGKSLSGIDEASLIRYESVLHEEERKRSAAYCFDHLRRDFIIGRVLLRTLLGHFMKIHPKNIVFSYGKYGKPHVLNKTGQPGLFFSVSNTTGMLVIALTADETVGVDMEQFDKANVERGLLEHSLSPLELACCDKTEGQGSKPFFHYWCRKEAYLKAIGSGLTDNLPAIDTSGLEVLITGRATGFLCHSFLPFPGYCMAFSCRKRQDNTNTTFQLLPLGENDYRHILSMIKGNTEMNPPSQPPVNSKSSDTGRLVASNALL